MLDLGQFNILYFLYKNRETEVSRESLYNNLKITHERHSMRLQADILPGPAVEGAGRDYRRE